MATYNATKDNLFHLKLGISLFLVGFFLAGHLWATPGYLDRTDREQWELSTKAFIQQINACREAGGSLINGVCSVEAKADLSWYTPPQNNPWYFPTSLLGSFFAAGALIGAVLILCTVGSLLLDAWGSRPKLHVRRFKKPFVL